MKKSFLFLVVILAVFLLINSKDLVISNEYIAMKVLEIPGNEVSLSLTNISEESYVYSNSYYVQIYEDSKWKTLSITDDLFFTAEGHILKAGESITLIIYNDEFENLDSGTYRIIKEISEYSEDENTINEEINASAEFIID